MGDTTALPAKEQATRELWNLWMDRLTQKITGSELQDREPAFILRAQLKPGEYEVLHFCMREQSDRYLRERKEIRLAGACGVPPA